MRRWHTLVPLAGAISLGRRGAEAICVTNWPVLPGRTDGLEFAVGHSVSWHEARPAFHREQPHAFATREIVSAPTSDQLQQPHLAAWQSMHAASLAMLSNAALMPGVEAFEVRYSAGPSNTGVPRVQMFLTAKAHDWHHEVAKAGVAAACDALPDGFASMTPEKPLVFGQDAPAGCAIVEPALVPVKKRLPIDQGRESNRHGEDRFPVCHAPPALASV